VIFQNGSGKVYSETKCGNLRLRREGHTTTTTTVLWLFVRDYPGEPVPEETLTHPPS